MKSKLLFQLLVVSVSAFVFAGCIPKGWRDGTPPQSMPALTGVENYDQIDPRKAISVETFEAPPEATVVSSFSVAAVVPPAKSKFGGIEIVNWAEPHWFIVQGSTNLKDWYHVDYLYGTRWIANSAPKPNECFRVLSP